jgi:Holliday junction DNA helicase RuvA
MLTGIVVEKDLEGLLIDVNGVGYQVRMDMRSIESLPKIGNECRLYIHTHMTESGWSLVGFHDKATRQCFKLLLSVNKVGVVVALNVLTQFSYAQLAGVIQAGDAGRLSTAKGVGKKTAEFIIIKLRDRFDDVSAASSGIAPNVASDLRSALLNLDLKPAHVEKILQKLDPQPEHDFEQLLRDAIALMRET